MKKGFKLVFFSALLVGSLAACEKEEQTNNANTENNTTDSPVVEKTLNGISLNTDSVKKTYTYGEALDLTGLVVTANYDDNSNKSVTSYTTNPANGAALNSVGDIPVTVNYEGKTASFNVNVKKALTGITLDTTNVKKDYKYGETLDLTGLVVTANYNNNTSEAVTDYTVDPANGYTLSTVGNVVVTVTYQGKKDSFNVRVDKVLTGITLNTDNVKKSYAHNETLDLTGLVVTANYNDNSSEVVTDYETNPNKNATLDTVGNKTITTGEGGMVVSNNYNYLWW